MRTICNIRRYSCYRLLNLSLGGVSKTMSERQTKAGNQEQSVTLTISHSLTLDMLNNFCFHVYAQKSLSHFHTLSLSHSRTLALSHSLTLSISHSLTLDMLNKFCFHLYAQNSLFIGENCNAFFLTSSSSASAPPDIRVHRAGSQLKIHKDEYQQI